MSTSHKDDPSKLRRLTTQQSEFLRQLLVYQPSKQGWKQNTINFKGAEHLTDLLKLKYVACNNTWWCVTKRGKVYLLLCDTNNGQDIEAEVAIKEIEEGLQNLTVKPGMLISESKRMNFEFAETESMKYVAAWFKTNPDHKYSRAFLSRADYCCLVGKKSIRCEIYLTSGIELQGVDTTVLKAQNAVAELLWKKLVFDLDSQEKATKKIVETKENIAVVKYTSAVAKEFQLADILETLYLRSTNRIQTMRLFLAVYNYIVCSKSGGEQDLVELAAEEDHKDPLIEIRAILCALSKQGWITCKEDQFAYVVGAPDASFVCRHVR